MINYYEVLGVTPKASYDEIRSAYRRLVKDYHPDKFQNGDEIGKKEATRRTKQINEAWHHLSDSGRRSTYDHVFFGSRPQSQSRPQTQPRNEQPEKTKVTPPEPPTPIYPKLPGKYWTFWLVAKTFLTFLLGLATISLPFLIMYVLLGYRTGGSVEGWGNLLSIADFFLLLGGIGGFLACLGCVFASIVRRRSDSSIDSDDLKLLVPLLAIQLLALLLAFPLANR